MFHSVVLLRMRQAHSVSFRGGGAPQPATSCSEPGSSFSHAGSGLNNSTHAQNSLKIVHSVGVMTSSFPLSTYSPPNSLVMESPKIGTNRFFGKKLLLFYNPYFCPQNLGSYFRLEYSLPAVDILLYF